MRFHSRAAGLLLWICALAHAQVSDCEGCKGAIASGESGPNHQASNRPSTIAPAIGVCGLLTAPPKLAVPAEQIPATLRLDPGVIGGVADRYPIAAVFLAVMASRPEAPNVFDAASVTLGLRHLPRHGTAMALLERGDEAMQAPFVTELAVFENVVVEARGERLASGGIAWWLLSSLETRKGSRVLEGPVRVVLADSGTRVSTSVGNLGVLAPVMAIERVD